MCVYIDYIGDPIGLGVGLTETGSSVNLLKYWSCDWIWWNWPSSKENSAEETCSDEKDHSAKVN